MDEKRRFFLASVFPGAILGSAAFLGLRSGASANFHQFPQNPPPQSPRAMPPPFLGRPSKAQLKENQAEIKKDVDQLFSLAQDLKEQAEKIDTVSVLSVAFVQKTEQIEKLAKKIRDLARY